MEKQVGRNDPCPCGSGLKFKKCCMRKTPDQKLAEAMVKAKANLKNDARIKQCLYPDKSACSDKIVHAHAIQNNRILNKIAENGMVVMLDGMMATFQVEDIKGRKSATTFTGFCSYHDKVLFQEIEDKDFTASEKQIFLLTYRTMAWHYQKKMEQANARVIYHKRMLSQGYDMSKSEDTMQFLTGLRLALDDNDAEKQIFDDALLSEHYSDISFSCWEIPYEIDFAISMMIELEYDIQGNRINDLERDRNAQKLYLNIFPAKDKSFCVWSWLKMNDAVYRPFANQFMALSVSDRENYFNNNLIRWSDSIVISPRLWNKWGEGIQQGLLLHANSDSLYRAMEDNDHAYHYMDTPWNLFENSWYAK